MGGDCTGSDVVQAAPGAVETETRHQTSLGSVPGARTLSSDCHIPEEMEVEVEEVEVKLRVLKKPQSQTKRLCEAECVLRRRGRVRLGLWRGRRESLADITENAKCLDLWA